MIRQIPSALTCLGYKGHPSPAPPPTARFDSCATGFRVISPRMILQRFGRGARNPQKMKMSGSALTDTV
jgi:hypothetical protein